MSGSGCFCVPTMDQDQSSSVPDAARFDSTRWTVVLEAAQSRAPGGPAALARLCARYWQPLYGFARRRGYGPEDAQDLVQGFLPTSSGIISFEVAPSADVEHAWMPRGPRGGPGSAVQQVRPLSAGRSRAIRRKQRRILRRARI